MNTAKLSKSIIKRKIITSILMISLVLGSFSFAFAYPTTADSMADALGAGWSFSNSGLDKPYGKDMDTSWYYIFGDTTIDMLRDIRYQLSGKDYNYHTGNSIFTYINNIYSTLTDTSSGSILYGINQQNTKLSDIYDSLGVGGAGNNVLTKLSSLINGQTNVNQSLNTIINNGIDVSLSQSVEDSIANMESVLTTPLFNPYNYVRRGDVYSTGNFQTINSNKYYPVVTMNNPDGRLAWDSVTINSNMDFLSAIYNGVLGVNNRLATMGTAYKSSTYTTNGAISQNSLYSIQDSLVVYGDNNSEQNNNIIEKLKTLDTDYNDIEFTNIGTFNGVYTSLENLTNGVMASNNARSNDMYVSYFAGESNYNLYRAYIPVRSTAVANFGNDVIVKLYAVNADNQLIVPEYYIIDYQLNANNSYVDLYIPTQFNNSTNIVIELFNGDTTRLLYDNRIPAQLTYINSVKNDYYTVLDNMYLKSIQRLFTQAKEMFFDDESLQAKKNNASQTTAVLTGFTGSGQASATANDYGTLSTGVSNVKGGMNTNVSANNAFGIFNNSNGYSFWSTETLQELNQSGTNTRSLSKSANDDGYEYYNNRLEYLLNAMTGGDK